MRGGYCSPRMSMHDIMARSPTKVALRGYFGIPEGQATVDQVDPPPCPEPFPAKKSPNVNLWLSRG